MAPTMGEIMALLEAQAQAHNAAMERVEKAHHQQMSEMSSRLGTLEKAAMKHGWLITPVADMGADSVVVDQVASA